MKRASTSEAVRNTLKGLAAIAGRELNEFAWAMIFSDLAPYSEQDVLAALQRYRRESKGFPCLSDIIERIDDGRPGAEEAWAMIPKDEAASVVWTEEMRDAFGIVRDLLERDAIAARKAFIEAYERLVVNARAKLQPAQWSPSLGHNKAAHAPVLLEAVRRGRITDAHAQSLLPEPATVARLQLPAPEGAELSAIDPTVMIAAIREQISKNGSTT